MICKNVSKFQEGDRAHPSPPSHMENRGCLSVSARVQQWGELMAACV